MLRNRAPLRFSSIVFTLGVVGSSPAVSQEGPLKVHPKGLNSVVAVAVFEAYRRLGDPVCREVFSEFRDDSGRPLQERLDAIGETAGSYLGWLRFVDGGVGGRCERDEVVAFTSPGSPVVRFCGDRFTRAVTKRGVGFLASIVIHEELHSLGLGENPPTSEEITRRVQARCGP
jgi:hypothetical protein